MEQPPSELAPSPTRRDALKKIAATLIGGLIVVIPGAAGLLVFLDPLRRKASAGASNSAAEGFVDIAPLSALPADGMPRRFQVLAERVDAWNRHAASPVGAVYLKRDAATPDKVVAFNVVCPHAGCFVEPAKEGAFYCPCHNSEFGPDGSVVPGRCVSPRGLDELAVDEAALKSGAIRVRFQNFIAGTHEKVPAA